jgi:toxin ParE1/3/4
MAAPTWRVRFGAAAELDFANIVKWTAENFGARQSRIYRDTLIRAIRELGEGPDVIGSKARNEIRRSSHVASSAAWSAWKSHPDVPRGAAEHDRNRAHLAR